MFVFDLLLNLTQIVVVGAGGAFFYYDYRRGWIRSRAVVVGTLNFIGIKGDPVAQAEREVARRGKELAAFRESVASVDAGMQMAQQRAEECRELAEGFENLVIKALEQGNTEAAEVAAEAQAQHEAQTTTFEGHATEQRVVLYALERDLENAEASFKTFQMGAETVKVNTRVAKAGRDLYALVSDVQEDGSTSVGDLKQLLQLTEHNRRTTSSLLERMKKIGPDRTRHLAEKSRVQQILECAKGKMVALPPAAEVTETPDTTDVTDVADNGPAAEVGGEIVDVDVVYVDDEEQGVGGGEEKRASQ